ncbi:MAG: sigma-70 family RNA polymerase sigma factor [Ruminococcus sp.]|nr:sigma-70 family RNA polymerase sigma factor [Ruminococcus sp.]
MTQGDRRRLSEENLGLVRLCANRFRGKGIEYDDLYGAGCMGLVKAARAFDEGRGVKFSTYAVPVILGEIKRLFREGGTVKVSRSLKELSLRLARLRDEFALRQGREPTVSELSALCGEGEEAVTEALGVTAPPLSLTAGGEDEGTEFDIPVEGPDLEIADRLALREALGELAPEERRLIMLRYYLGKTQQRTAEIMGMTQVQVSRKEKKLLEKLRERME